MSHYTANDLYGEKETTHTHTHTHISILGGSLSSQKIMIDLVNSHHTFQEREKCLLVCCLQHKSHCFPQGCFLPVQRSALSFIQGKGRRGYRSFTEAPRGAEVHPPKLSTTCIKQGLISRAGKHIWYCWSWASAKHGSRTKGLMWKANRQSVTVTST